MIKNHIAKRRFLIGFIISIIGVIGPLVVLYFANATRDEQLDHIIYAVTLGLFIIGTIYSFVLNRSHVYYETQTKLIIKKGILFRRVIEIDYHHISAITINQTLLDQIFKISTVIIDITSTKTSLSERKLYLSQKKAMKFKKYLEQKQTNQNELIVVSTSEVETNVKFSYQFKAKEIFLSGLFDNVVLNLLICGYLVMMSGLIFLNHFTQIFSSLSNTATIVFIIIVPIGVVVVIAAIIALLSLLSLWGYRVKIADNYIEYQYGLLNKTLIKVEPQNINAVIVKQSLGYRVLKRYNVKISVLGIADGSTNNKKNESRSLLPYANRKKIEEVLKLLNIKLNLDQELVKPTRFRCLNLTVAPFMVYVGLVLTPLIVIAAIYQVELFFLFVFLLIIFSVGIFICCFEHMRAQGYRTNSDIMVVKTGAINHRSIIIKYDKIQTVVMSQGPIYQLQKVHNIRIQYRSSQGSILLTNYQERDYLEIEDKLKNK